MFLEHVKIDLSELTTLDTEIEKAEARLSQLESERQALLDAEAAKIAIYKVGDEFEGRGKRYRIVHVRGEVAALISSTMWVRYHGVKLFKNGAVGPVHHVYPPGRV